MKQGTKRKLDHKHDWKLVADYKELETNWWIELSWCRICGTLKEKEFNIHGDPITTYYIQNKKYTNRRF